MDKGISEVQIGSYSLGTTFTSYAFYNQLLKALREYYLQFEIDKIKKPNLTLYQMDHIDPIVLPNLVCLGVYLKAFHRESIPLKLKYAPKLNLFLEYSNFFKLVGEDHLNIFEYQKEFIGGLTDVKHDKNHKIHIFYPRKEYELIEKVIDQDKYRDKLIQDLELEEIPIKFKEILAKSSTTKENQETIIESLAELISNSMLHSKSVCCALLNTNKFRTAISISDVGIGFESSLRKKIKSKELKILNWFKEYNKYEKKIHDFIFIFEALSYSLVSKRKGLGDLLFLVLNNNSTLRIHFKSVQVIFTSHMYLYFIELIKFRDSIIVEKKKKNPNTSIIIELENEIAKYLAIISNYMLENISSNKETSKVRFYEIDFPGVHIEVEFKN